MISTCMVLTSYVLPPGLSEPHAYLGCLWLQVYFAMLAVTVYYCDSVVITKGHPASGSDYNYQFQTCL